MVKLTCDKILIHVARSQLGEAEEKPGADRPPEDQGQHCAVPAGQNHQVATASALHQGDQTQGLDSQPAGN